MIKKYKEFINESSSSNYVKNPFGCKQEDGTETSALLVVGESGVGKSVRVERTLENSGHKYIVITPGGVLPGKSLLLDEDISSMRKRNLPPNIKLPPIYTLSNLGEFILEALRDPSKYYTVIFEQPEHYIDIIEDELKQCLSSKFYGGMRFISDDTESFTELPEKHGCSLIPDNLGFILITLKKYTESYDDGIMKRLDLIELNEDDKDKDFTIDNLLNKVNNV